jgi:hypothetical protein
MPILVAGLVVGACAYGAWRAYQKWSEAPPPANGPDVRGPVMKDLGTFERDPKTGVFGPPDTKS